MAAMEMEVAMTTVNNQGRPVNKLKRTSAPAKRPSCPRAILANRVVMLRDRESRLCHVQINEVCN